MSKLFLSAFADEIAPDLFTQMDILDQHKIKFIEMRGVNGKNISEHTLDEVRNIKNQFASRGFSISAIGSPIGKTMITDDFDSHFELFQHVLDIAQVLDTKYVRIFSFYIPKDSTPEKHRDAVMLRIKKMVAEAEVRGVILLHENEKDIYGDVPERCLDIFETIKSKFLRATFDPANFVQCGVNPYPEAFKTLEKYIEYVHIKDAIFSDRSVVPAGEGDGRLKDIIRMLIRNGYEGFLSLEPHLTSFTGLQNLEQHTKTPMKTKGDGEIKFQIAANALNKILEEINLEV